MRVQRRRSWEKMVRDSPLRENFKRRACMSASPTQKSQPTSLHRGTVEFQVALRLVAKNDMVKFSSRRHPPDPLFHLDPNTPQSPPKFC